MGIGCLFCQGEVDPLPFLFGGYDACIRNLIRDLIRDLIRN